MSYSHEQNKRAWDARARQQQRFTKPAQDELLDNPMELIDGSNWMQGDINNKRVLCLAAGGGRQSAMYAAAGAIVTVVDISPEMLALDRQVAEERQMNIRVIEASMDDLSGLETASFDIVSQPVSTCYVPEIMPVFREVARVLVAGGLYISQHKQPTSLQVDIVPSPQGYEVTEPYFRSGPLPQVSGSRHREEGTLEYLHRLEEIIGGICRSGFVIEDFIEPFHADEKCERGTFQHRSCYVAPYLRVKARRTDEQAADKEKSIVWTGD